MKRDRTLLNVSIFTVAMILVAAMLIVVFGEFRFTAEKGYHATFTDASRLKAGQDVRIAGVPVGTVNDVKLNEDNTVDVAFDRVAEAESLADPQEDIDVDGLTARPVPIRCSVISRRGGSRRCSNR